MSSDGLSKAIFGACDGVTCVLGVIAAGYITGDTHALVLAAVGLAIAEGIAMAGGSYLSELVNVHRIEHAAIIGVAACVGVLVPALPFLFAPRPTALVLSLLCTLVLAVVIAQAKVKESGWLRAYVQTLAILFVAGGASVLVTLALNGV